MHYSFIYDAKKIDKTIILCSDSNGLLLSVDFMKKFKAQSSKTATHPQNVARLFTKAKNQLDDYFDLKRKSFDLPLKFIGTDFQIKVWTCLQGIPFGQTVSYSQIASMIQNSLAVRAVGSAIGKNPFPIIIPCHRVILSTSKIGNYTGGVAIKNCLLTHEGFNVLS